jgi:hypothetical protein
MRKTGAPVANNIDSTRRIEKWKRTARASAVRTVLPLQVVEPSGREVEQQVGPPLHVLGAQVDPSVADRFDAIICNNLHKRGGAFSRRITCLRAADTADQRLACARQVPSR